MEEIPEYQTETEAPEEQAPEIKPEIELAKLIGQLEKLQQMGQEQLQRNMQLQRELATVKSQLDTMLKKRLEEEIEITSLVKDETGEEKPVSIIMRYKAPSPRVRGEMLSIQMAHANEFTTTLEDYVSRGMDKAWLEMETSELAGQDQLLLFGYRHDIYMMQMRYNLLYFKTIIDDSQLLTDAKGWVRGGIDTDFYQNIDYGEVEKAVISFRIHYDLR